ncbi:TonB-dependent receptor [Dialister sp.]|uniref:TonB-dependent receptor n=1 Tax=Dialister sp. TaxID=1955814 RepID=UPI002E816627|nr:TonB-dependent receptor [Dialister sp.]MEE3452591.1 TonB-dependent receptor [Dialister sp.]
MKFTCKKTAAFLAVLALGGFYGADAAGMPVYTLKGITVTANRQAERLQDVPATVQVVTEKEIQTKNAQNTAQAVAMATGVSGSQSIEGTVSLRGYDSKNILVLVDGQQMNTAWNGDVDWNMIPVNNIRKIEVVSGGQSALYGGRAVGGVINIITKTQKQDGLHGSAFVTYGSHATVNQGYNLGFKKDKVSVGAFYNSNITDGWRDYLNSATSAQKKYLSGQDETDAKGNLISGNRGKKHVMSESYGFNVGYDFNDNQRLTYKFVRSNYDWKYNDPVSYLKKGNTTMWPGVDFKDGSSTTTFYGARGWRAYNMHSLTYNDQKNKVHAHIGMVDYLKDGYTYPRSNKKGALDSDFNGAGKKTSYPSKTWNFDVNKRWTLGAHTVLFGGAYTQSKFSETIENEISDWKSWNGKSKGVDQRLGGKDKSFAFYLQDKWAISKKWTAYVGGRYDHYKKYDGYNQYAGQDAKTFGSASYDKFSPKLSVDYAFDDNTNAYISYGKSFNPPILYQVYRYADRSGTKYETNPSLKPETTDTWELGLKKKIGNKTDIHADVFYAKTKDDIGLEPLDPAGKTKQYQNRGESKTHGFELSLNQRHSDAWTSYINYTWQIGKVDGDKNYDIPRHLLHLGTTYNKDAWTFNADGMFISDRTEAGLKSGHFKARDTYFLMNVSAAYQFTKNFNLQFGINNLFDREYYDEDIVSNHYYVGDGRTYTLTARYSF